MRILILSSALFLFALTAPLIPKAHAAEPDCFRIVNRAPYTVIGTVNGNYDTLPSGQKVRRNRNFRLAPNETAEMCTTGPYYEGDRVELVIRTLVPLFSCFTLPAGEIPIYGERRPEGGTRTWAECR